MGQKLTGMMDPLGRQGQAMDGVICEEWDERPHCAKGSRIRQTGQGNRPVITKNIVNFPLLTGRLIGHPNGFISMAGRQHRRLALISRS